MAGTFTHWMVAEEALDKYKRLPDKHPYFPSILGQNHFVGLGAVGHDYPYLTELLSGFLKIHSWADRMHYENTGEFVRYGIKNLLTLGKDGFNTCLAWLCGFTTQLVTDSAIHPVVLSIVGPYIFNTEEHRHCELIQDSYIFHAIKRVEIEYAQYSGLFRMCSDPNDEHKVNRDLSRFWTETLKATHPTAIKHFDKIDPEEWQRFVRQVNLPGNKIGEFRKNAFDKAVDTVIDTWQRLFVDIENKNADVPAAYIRKWNLDTGVDEDKPYSWP